MARRVISAPEEEQLIADAERARDSGIAPTPTTIRRAQDASAVLSVRLSTTQLRSIRDLATSRGVSISVLLQTAVDQLLAQQGPRLTLSRHVTRVFVAGATSENLGEGNASNRVVHQDPAPATTS
jgi:hypothetical protein